MNAPLAAQVGLLTQTVNGVQIHELITIFHAYHLFQSLSYKSSRLPAQPTNDRLESSTGRRSDLYVH